jgi:protein TonB
VKERSKGWLLVGATVSLALHLAVFRLVRLDTVEQVRVEDRIHVELEYVLLPEESGQEAKTAPESVVEPAVEQPPEPPETEPEPVVEPEEVQETGEMVEPEPLVELREPAEDSRESDIGRSAEEASDVPSAGPAAQDERARVPDLSRAVNGFIESLMKKKVYPYVARRRGIQGTVVVLVTLDIDGELLEARVLHPSGYTVLDKAALSLVLQAVPYAHNTGIVLTMEVPIRYVLLED